MISRARDHTKTGRQKRHTFPEILPAPRFAARVAPVASPYELMSADVRWSCCGAAAASLAAAAAGAGSSSAAAGVASEVASILRRSGGGAERSAHARSGVSAHSTSRMLSESSQLGEPPPNTARGTFSCRVTAHVISCV